MTKPAGANPANDVATSLEKVVSCADALERARCEYTAAQECELQKLGAPAYTAIMERMERQIEAGIRTLGTAVALIVDPTGSERLEREHAGATAPGQAHGASIRQLAQMLLREIDGHRLDEPPAGAGKREDGPAEPSS